MPTVRYQIRNEYGLADPEVYRAAEKDDPEALLEGVAMAGLVGILRQLGDLAQFAAEVFHDLHEEVMATSARGHGLILRVQQLDAEFPFIEKDILSQIDHSLNAYNAGIDWHPTLRVEQNLIIQGDMPRFILDSYEECRGPPQLFMLDKFDVAGAGACLTRYSNPSFFKTESASSELMESELQREKRPRKIKKGSNWRNDETTNSFFMPIMDYSQFIASEPVPEKFPSRLIKLKHRNLRVSDLSNKKSYMEGLIHGLVKQNDPKISLGGSNTSKVINGVFEADQILNDSMNDPSQFREEVITQFSEEVSSNFKNVKRNGNIFLENAKEEDILMALSNEIDIHDFDISSDENYLNPRPLQLREPNNLLVDPGFITDVDHDSYGSDDVGSELENYVDALNTLETEVETDSEIKVESGPRFFNSESQGLNPNINGHLELQPEYSGSDFDTRVSSNVVDLAYQLQLSTIFEESFGSEIKINQVKSGKFDRAGDCKELVPLACFPSDEACYQVQTDAIGIVPLAGLPSNEVFSQKQHNVTMLVPVNRDTLFSSSEGEPALKLMWDLKQTELLGTHSVEVNEYVDSFLLPWKTNHVTVPPTFKENPDAVEEDNMQVHSGDWISETISDKDHIPSDSSKDDEIAKTLQMQEHEDKIDGVSGNLLSSTPMGSILKSYDTSIEMEFGMHPKYSTMKITSAQSSDEIKKLLNCNVLLPAALHELSTLVKDDNGSHESTQTLENVGEDLAYISDEGLKVSAECVTNQSRESSVCSFEIFSSTNLQLECLVGQFSNIVATPEEFLHPQSPASTGDVDIFGGDASTSPSISVYLERYPVDRESQQSANLGILDPLISRSAQLHLEAVKLIETNDNDHAKDELEITNASSKVDLNDELLVGESKIYNKPLDGNVIIDNGVDGQVINMLESEKAFCSDLLFMIEDSVSKDEVMSQLSPDDESITRRETIFSPLENKSYCKLIHNEEQDMFMNSVSSQKSALDLANFFVTNLKNINVDDPHVMLQPSLNEDNMCSTENKQESDPIAENAITEDDTDKKLLSMLQSSNLCSFDSLLLEVPVAESASLNEHMPEIEYLDTANHDSQPKNDITEIGTDHQNISLLETSDAYGFEEAPVFEDASLNQHKLEFEAPAITSDLTSSKFEKDFFAPFSTKGGREEPFSVVSSSQSHTIYSSYNANAMLPGNNCDDIVLEFHPSVYERSFNEQASYSVASLQPFQTSAERLELQPDTASVSEPSTRSLPDITLDHDCSDKRIRCNLEHDMLITQPEPEAFCEHGSNKELCMPSAKAHIREQIEIDLSVPLSDASEPSGSVMASKDLTSKSIVADSSSPISITSTEEPPTVLLGETISGFSLMEGIEEAPHLPPLPPIQWIMGKPMMDANPCTYSSNVHMDEHAGPFKLGTAIEDKFPCVSPCTDFAQMTDSAVFEHGHNAHSYIAMEGNESYGLEERRPKLVKLLPSLELERSQEASIVDTDAVPSFNPFMFMPITGDQTYHYDFKDYVGYDGGNQQHHSFSSSFPVSVHGFPHYGYHSYDITLPQVEGDNQNGKHRFIRNRQRNPLIEAVAAHDKSTLRKVSDVDHPLIKSKEETNYLLEQIKNKSSNLKPATSAKASILKAPSTNLKVAAILQKANAIRQACVGSDDEDDDDNWS